MKKIDFLMRIISLHRDNKLKVVSFSLILVVFFSMIVSCTKNISLRKSKKKSVKAQIFKPIKNIFTKKITIISNPPGAKVYVDDILQGVTPITLEFKSNLFDFLKGFSVFVEKKGFLPARRKVDYNQTRVIFNLFSRK
ncbi:MAG: PEGA domain-containing protein [bacterium]